MVLWVGCADPPPEPVVVQRVEDAPPALGPRADTAEHTSTRACQACHPSVVAEWSDSLHRHSAGSNPWFAVAFRADPDPTCLACHAPGATTAHPDAAVVCRTCHGGAEHPAEPADLASVPALSASTRAPTSPDHLSLHRTALAAADVCTVCHTGAHNAPGTHLLPLVDRPTPPACTTCHMPEVERAVVDAPNTERARTYPDRLPDAPPSPPTHTGHSHRFAGAHRSAATTTAQRAAVDHQSAERVDLRVVAAIPTPEGLQIDVVMRLSGSPHAFPSPDDQRNVLVVSTGPHASSSRSVVLGSTELPPQPAGAARLVRFQVAPDTTHFDVVLHRLDRDALQDAKVCAHPPEDTWSTCPEDRHRPRRNRTPDLDHAPGPRLVGAPAVVSSGTVLAAAHHTIGKTPDLTASWRLSAADAYLRVGAVDAATALLETTDLPDGPASLLRARAALLRQQPAVAADALQRSGDSVASRVLASILAEQLQQPGHAAHHLRAAAVQAPTSVAVLRAWSRAARLDRNPLRADQIDRVVDALAPGTQAASTDQPLLPCTVTRTDCPPVPTFQVPVSVPGR